MLFHMITLAFASSTIVEANNVASFQVYRPLVSLQIQHSPCSFGNPSVRNSFDYSYRTPTSNPCLRNMKSPSLRPTSTSTTLQMMTSLQTSSPATATLMAATTLITATLFGLLYDKYIDKGGGGGNVVTLAVAAMLSNLGWAPTSHMLYDLSWTRFLPASLALVLLSSPSSRILLPSSSNGNNTTNEMHKYSTKYEDSTKNIVGAVSMPFLLGSIGSILGCVISYFVFSPSLSSLCNTGSKFLSFLPKSVIFQPAEAAAAAGCLCASYIGGSVNFFATARILSESKLLEGSVDISSLLGSMASADILVMVLYFASLTAGMKSKLLWSLFPGRHTGSALMVSSDTPNAVMKIGDSDENKLLYDATRNRDSQTLPQRRRNLIVGGMVGALIAWIIVEASIVLEQFLSVVIPGTGCAFIALFGTFAKGILGKVQLLSQGQQKKGRQHVVKGDKPSSFPILYHLVEGIRQMAPPMSDICFYLLFASIGTSADLSECLRHGPSSFAFALLALFVHVLFTLYGALFTSKVFQYSQLAKFFPLGLDEVMVASNAAIGGPATAAAFAGKVGCAGDSEKRGKSRHGLVVAATVWGVVGYAVATGIGVTLTKLLL